MPPPFTPPIRRAVLLSPLPFPRPISKLPLSLLSLSAKTLSLAALQSILGSPPRWHFLQLCIALSATNIPPLAFLRPFILPLVSSCIYSLLARTFAPAHARSLQFWKRVIPIYLGYKKTQRFLKFTKGKSKDKIWARRHKWGAEKVYNLCVDLRGFYLKDGQFLGARSDLVPLAWCDSLRRLQDRVPPVPFHEIEQTVREEYRVNKFNQIFKSIDPVPLASATIAQVHRGEMPDGTPIVLKAQYRDQERLCEMDLLNLKRLAGYLQKHDMSFFDMNSVVEEFESQIPTEFDFVREAEMMTTVRANLRRAGIFDVVVPRAIPGLVSRRALAMTYVDGCRPDNAVAMNLWGIKPKDVIKALGRAYGQMLLCDGLAHCDPHLGNLIVLRDKRVALIDFGQAKEIPTELRQKLCAFYLALNSKNNLYIMKTFNDLGIELDIPLDRIEASFLEMIPVYANGLLDTAPLHPDVEINPFSEASPLKKVPIRKFNPDLFMVLRTMGLLRSLTETLQAHGSDCWMSVIFKPYAKQGLRQREGSEAQKKKRSAAVRSYLTSGVSSPFDSMENDSADLCSVC